MTIEIRPETELIVSGVRAWREKHPASAAAVQPRPLSEFFRQSPLVGLVNQIRERLHGSIGRKKALCSSASSR